MLNIAHRGFKGAYPENTMLAFKKAYEMGVYAIELDVHLSKNNELIIIHDEKIDKNNINWYYIKVTCRIGGIGRRERLRILCPILGRGSSSLLSCTRKLNKTLKF